MSSIRVVMNGKICRLPVETGENLLSALRRAGYSLPASCGGRGRCGKCRVPVNGVPRLACKVIAQDGDTVELPEQAGGVILTDASAQNLRLQPGRTGCGAAVDLGTTTVVIRLYDLEVGTLLSTVSAWNAQASYGADVISRIQYTLERADGAEALSRRIRAQVQQLLTDALHRAERDWSELREITLAGNTVMQHLFDDRTVAGIAAVPFEPETLFTEPAGKPLCGVPVRFAPCVAGYVGGDITAGLLASGLMDKSGNHLFLDIGTNGEMALGERTVSSAVRWPPARPLRVLASPAECRVSTGRSAMCVGRADSSGMWWAAEPPRGCAVPGCWIWRRCCWNGRSLPPAGGCCPRRRHRRKCGAGWSGTHTETACST